MAHERPQDREEDRPLDVEGVPEEEGVSDADAAERVDEDPDEQRNRPDQPGVSAEERRQFNDPPVETAGPDERPLSDHHHPEDR